MPPPTLPPSYKATMVQTMEQRLLSPLTAASSGWFRSLTSCPIKAQGQENFPSLLLISAPPSLAHTCGYSPLMQCSSITQSVELHWSSFHWQCTICFLWGLCLRQVASTSSPCPLLSSHAGLFLLLTPISLISASGPLYLFFPLPRKPFHLSNTPMT